MLVLRFELVSTTKVAVTQTIIFFGILNKSLSQGQKPDIHAAKKVASTDTLGSDAALDQESNDSLYGW